MEISIRFDFENSHLKIAIFGEHLTDHAKAKPSRAAQKSGDNGYARSRIRRGFGGTTMRQTKS